MINNIASVLIPEKIPLTARDLLLQAGYHVVSYKGNVPFPSRQWLRDAQRADALITLLDNRIDKKIIESLTKCRVIANYAVGFNNIDVQAANDKGIIVTNTPDVLTDATADLAFALILATARHIVTGDSFVRDNQFKGWKPDLLLGMELRGNTLGIVGAGRIGMAVAIRAKAFGMNILYYNRSRKVEFEKLTGAKKVSLPELIKKSDVISLHVPLNGVTHQLISKELLESMKSTAIIINTARGEIVDEKALITLLQKKKIFGAGIDVYENEPAINPALLQLHNVVLAPHVGSATYTARNRMAAIAAKNIIQVLSGKKPLSPVKPI